MLKRYDEALKSFQDFLKRNPKPAQACAAEFGIATIYKETDKIPEAIAAFKKVREKYVGTPQAEQSSFWVGQLALQKGDIAAAMPELTAFLKNFPKSELFPTAKFGLAQANLAKNDKPTALQLFKEVSDEFPKSAPATFCYFQRASVLAGEQKVDEMVALMKEFIKNYPDDDKVFYAYDTVGQNLINTSKPDEAIVMYAEMVDKHPNDQHASQALLNLVQLWHQHTTAQGRYLALNEEQRAEWNKGIANSTAMAEKLITQFPASTQVATTLQELIEDQKLLVGAKLKTDADLTKYFQDLAGKFGDKPDTKSKILFTLAAFIYDSDKAKGLELMKSAYNPQLVFAPEDIDLYGTALLEQGNVDDSAAVYQKLANDFLIPAGVTPDKAPPQVQAAQAIALYGAGKAQQKQGKVAEAGATFDKLKTLYPWSPKLLEANFGIAEAMHQQQKEDDAILLLGQIIRAQTATAELRANSMLLLGDIQLSKNDIAAAIDQYIKIPVFYESVPKAASEGLWRGAQLLEKQAATLPEAPVKKGDPTKPGQLAKAVRSYQDIVSKYPASEHAKDAKARLDSLQPPRN